MAPLYLPAMVALPSVMPDDIQAGMVGINVPIPVPPWSHSFGGWKASAFTDSKISGPESLNFHTRIKAIISRWPDPAESKVDLGFFKDR